MTPSRPSRTSPGVSKSLGRPSQKSRAKADTNAERTQAQNTDDAPLLTPDGRPMAMVEMSASELIPTGQFANISVGPARVRLWIDPKAEDPIPEGERDNIAKALNQLAELVEVDVVAIQRSLVLESMQAQISSDNNK